MSLLFPLCLNYISGLLNLNFALGDFFLTSLYKKKFAVFIIILSFFFESVNFQRRGGFFFKSLPHELILLEIYTIIE